MIVASTGRFWVTWVWRADEPAAYSTTSPIPAPTASTATATAPVGLPSTSHARTTRSFSPSSVGSLRLATSVPMTLPRTTAPLLLAVAAGLDRRPAERHDGVDVGVRPRDHVDRHDLADALGGALAGLGRRLDRGDVAAHDRGHVAAAGLLVPDELDLGGLDHRVGGLDHADKTFDLDHSKRVSHASSPASCRCGYLSTNFSGSLPVTPASAAVAAAAAASISASAPDMYSRPNAPYGVRLTSETCAAFSASFAASTA